MNRRQLLGGMVGAGAVIGIGPGGSLAQGTPQPPANGVQPDGSWLFVDDRGLTVVSDHVPTRIFADLQAGLSLYAYGIKPIGLVGWGGIFEIPEELADVPFLDLNESGNEYDMELITLLDPDLSVGITWSVDTDTDWAGVDETTIPGFTDLAPTLCILGVVQPVDVSIARFEELALALGATIETPEIQTARSDFETAVQAVRDAAAAKSGLTAIATSPAVDAFYLGNSAVASDLVFFNQLGLQFVELDSPELAVFSGLWQTLSWEQVADYQADLYLTDDRPYAMSVEELTSQPTFAMLPAVAAGQISSWTVEYLTTYAGFAPILVKLADAINASEIVTEQT